MAQLNSILGSALISNSPSVLNGNYQNLNLGLISAQTSIVSTTSLLSAKVQVFSVAGASMNITTTATDKVIAWAKGTITGSSSSGSVALIYNGVTKDAAAVKQAAGADETSFALMYSETPGVGTNTIQISVIANGGLTVTNPKIIVQIIT